MHTTKLKRVVSAVVWTLVPVLCFGYGYFGAAHKSWSWPIAGLLAGLWGIVCILVIRRSCRSADQSQEQSDESKEHT